ncbi:hypothetical protein [Kordia sp.]|nr:hypothetical protein [Kordia sp.]
MKSQNVYVSEKIISKLQTHLKAFDDQEKIQVFEKSLVRKA